MNKTEIAAEWVKDWATRARGYNDAKTADTKGCAPIPVALLPIIRLAMEQWHGGGMLGTDAAADQKAAAQEVAKLMSDEANYHVDQLMEAERAYVQRWTEAEA